MQELLRRRWRLVVRVIDRTPVPALFVVQRGGEGNALVVIEALVALDRGRYVDFRLSGGRLFFVAGVEKRVAILLLREEEAGQRGVALLKALRRDAILGARVVVFGLVLDQIEDRLFVLRAVDETVHVLVREHVFVVGRHLRRVSYEDQFVLL